MPTSTTLEPSLILDAFFAHHIGKRTRAQTGFINFACPVCPARGHGPDGNRHCGIKHDGTWTRIHCFRCGFGVLWTPGRYLSRDFQNFLIAAGVPTDVVADLRGRAARGRGKGRAGTVTNLVVPSPAIDLPQDAYPLSLWMEEGCRDQDLADAVAYAVSRGGRVAQHPDLYWSPQRDFHRSLIVPFREEGRIVGYTCRAIDPDVRRYWGARPPGFLFNTQVLDDRRRRYALVVEGVFDAIALDGIALLGSTLSQAAISRLRGSGKTIVVVPDRDAAGGRLALDAARAGFEVSMPWESSSWWGREVKDVAEAARRYGSLYALTSVLKSVMADPLRIRIGVAKLL